MHYTLSRGKDFLNYEKVGDSSSSHLEMRIKGSIHAHIVLIYGVQVRLSDGYPRPFHVGITPETLFYHRDLLQPCRNIHSGVWQHGSTAL